MDLEKKVSKEEWLRKVKIDLKDKELESLNWELDGKSYTPFYHIDDKIDTGNVSVQKSNQWRIGTHLCCQNEKETNDHILQLLMQGANHLHIRIDDAENTSFDELFAKVNLDWISTYLYLSSGHIPYNCILNYLTLLDEKGIDPNTVECTFDADVNEIDHLLPCIDRLSQGSFFTIYAGSSFDTIHDEVAQLMLQGNSILKKLSNTDIDPSRWSSLISFTMHIDNRYFVSIAKIRAFRLVWQQVLDAWQVAGKSDIVIDMVSSSSEPDINTIKIHQTTQAMAAVIGGVDTLVIHPSNENADDDYDSFNQRIALNINHILQAESYLSDVVDPSAGSYFIESLTNDIASRAWTVFQNKVD